MTWFQQQTFLTMEQKDYFLREIEKIGLILQAILNSLIKNKENLAITIEKQFEESKELLLNEIDFDLDTFLTLNESDLESYIAQIRGLNLRNLELLADIISHMGFEEKPDLRMIYLQKALLLYDCCNQADKTYSFDRENKIAIIKRSL